MLMAIYKQYGESHYQSAVDRKTAVSYIKDLENIVLILIPSEYDVIDAGAYDAQYDSYEYKDCRL